MLAGQKCLYGYSQLAQCYFHWVNLCLYWNHSYRCYVRHTRGKISAGILDKCGLSTLFYGLYKRKSKSVVVEADCLSKVAFESILKRLSQEINLARLINSKWAKRAYIEFLPLSNNVIEAIVYEQLSLILKELPYIIWPVLLHITYIGL